MGDLDFLENLIQDLINKQPISDYDLYHALSIINNLKMKYMINKQIFDPGEYDH